MMEMEIDDDDKCQDVGAVTAAYLDKFDEWLEVNHCNSLKKRSDWERFYVILAEMTVQKGNKTKGEEEKIDINSVAIPRPTELFQWCRLLYQGLVPLRIGVIDGQHRMCAIINLLTGWSVHLVEKQIPPKEFRLDSDKFVFAKRDEEAEKNYLKTVLNAMTVAKPTVRVIVAQPAFGIEYEARQYSRDRDRSQSLKKQRNLVDV